MKSKIAEGTENNKFNSNLKTRRKLYAAHQVRGTALEQVDHEGWITADF